MTLRAFFVTAVTLLAMVSTFAPVAAQPVAVRGGEHANFTRLVLNLPEGTAWDLRTLDTAAVLTWSRTGLALDLSATFARIPRTRLRNAFLTDNGALQLELACACTLRVFEDLPGLLVIDIMDPSDAGRARAPVLIPVGAADPAATAGRTLANTLRRRAGSDGSDMVAGSELEARLTRDLAAALESASGVNVPAMPDTRSLSEEKAWEVAWPRAVLPSATQDPHAEAQADEADALRSQIRIGSSDSDGSVLAAHCLAPAALALENWADARAFDTQLAQARARLVGEFDRPDPEAISVLARLYLHFGFGAEVRALIRAFPVAVPDADLLRALSFIVDDKVPSNTGRLSGQADCPTSAALWAVLSLPVGADLPGLDVAALRRAFFALPGHQRRALGPAVVARLLARGDTDAARVVAEAARRAARASEGDQLDLALARVALAEGGNDTRYIPPSLAAPTKSPEALVLLLDRMALRGEVPDRDLAETAGVLAFEHRGTPLGHDLIRAQALALAAGGAHDDAFAVAARLLQEAPGAFARVRTALFSTLAQDAPDAAFVAGVFAERPWSDPFLSGSIRLALGARMAELGFPAHARLLLGGDHPDLQSEAATLVIAESFLSEGNTTEAARVLAAVSRNDPATEGQIASLEARIVAHRGVVTPRFGAVGPEAPAPGIPSAAPGSATSGPSAIAPQAPQIEDAVPTILADPTGSAAPEPGDRAPDTASPTMRLPSPTHRSAASTAPMQLPGPAPVPTPSPSPESDSRLPLSGDTPEALRHEPDAGGLLSQSRAALAESNALRASIEALLQAASEP